MGVSRLADMDAARIDMQVLSYGGFPQLLPAAQAIDLCRTANDRLAATVAAHPSPGSRGSRPCHGRHPRRLRLS